MSRAPVVIVTPALAAANNGNWRTAARWSRMLAPDGPVHLVERWDGGDEAAMIALHARRSAPSIAAWRAAHPQRPLVVVMTGTDLYADIDRSPEAQRSLVLADRLVVLNELGVQRLPAAVQVKAVVCVQSTPARPARPKPQRHLRALMVGHLRDEKSPQTYWAAARRLQGRADIRLDHIGAALDPALGEQARATGAACPHFRWLGGLAHGAALRRIGAASVLVHASRMEGGAQVVIEAVVRGTPVIASRIDGNVGLLGADYGGYFPFADDAALAALLARCRDEPAMLAGLTAQCAASAAKFAPEREQATLRAVLADLMETAR